MRRTTGNAVEDDSERSARIYKKRRIIPGGLIKTGLFPFNLRLSRLYAAYTPDIKFYIRRKNGAAHLEQKGRKGKIRISGYFIDANCRTCRTFTTTSRHNARASLRDARIREACKPRDRALLVLPRDVLSLFLRATASHQVPNKRELCVFLRADRYDSVVSDRVLLLIKAHPSRASPSHPSSSAAN